MQFRLGLLQAMLCLSLPALAGAGLPPAAADTAVPSVAVHGAVPDRDEKSYRAMLAAMEVFDQNRSLAPGASLRFMVLPRQADVAMDGLVLQIVGEHTKVPVPLESNYSFVLPRNADAAQDGAVVRFNRQAKSLAWRADIRSPGVPSKARRLGDLLLECKVAMVGDLVAYVHHPINMMIAKLQDPCRTLPINMFYFAERALFSITLTDGGRRSIMPAAMLYGPAAPMMPSQEDWIFLRERVFMVKFKSLYEKGWTDDTLLQFEYMDDEAGGLASDQ
ncbi:hypothetical protein [Massilia sp. BJB1822]|uniref:hypothetical protein n=1 Tax=Massilia sp. BJB1822 TaxID=2744470 RepID=UPI0015942A98|nr:hypothetical protein [Massilia sp. BJB1822]NVE00093.1 hypothetical protein [Massilia sp. BJB1822]